MMITSLFKDYRSMLIPASVIPRLLILGFLAIPVPAASLALFPRFGSIFRFIRSHCRVKSGLFLGLLVIVQPGCATPQQQLDRQAGELGLQRQILDGTGFRHVVYHNRIPIDKVLHVYLDGDGSPWRRRDRIAADPTPRRPLALQLMALDRQPSLYLGRPCYHGLHRDPECSPLLWTAGRYSRPVVDSLVAALRTRLRDVPEAELILIGYSGGGTLAMLMAEQLPQTRAIVTVAANLDIDAWTRQHGYSPLAGSLNPAERVPLPVPQRHLLGDRDDNVPPALVEPVVQRQPCARAERIAGFDHRCCWLDFWPVVLQTLTDNPPTCSDR